MALKALFHRPVSFYHVKGHQDETSLQLFWAEELNVRMYEEAKQGWDLQPGAIVHNSLFGEPWAIVAGSKVTAAAAKTV